MEHSMKKSFYIALVICVLLADSNLIKWMVYFTHNLANLQDSLKFVFYGDFLDQIYMLIGKSLSFIGVILIILCLYRNTTTLPRLCGIWFSLLFTFGYYWWAIWDLWSYLVLGEKISSTSAIAFVFVTLYSNIVGLIAGTIGYYFGKFIYERTLSLS
jgi:hypothetical protein